MDPYFETLVLQSTGAEAIVNQEEIQSLWSGYGQILRLWLKGCSMKSVVVKHVRLPENNNHPRGWNTNLSHNRKVKSYEVETEWYLNLSRKSNEYCKLPICYALETKGKEVFMILEDLDVAGYPVRKSFVNGNEMEACINWLANFHATFMHVKPDGLWQKGTYWHLETRPEELEVLDDLPLKNAAEAIDQKLDDTPYKTLVHGDAKLANFCFSKSGTEVAAVDFQYVGGGCGMKDLAYFVGSCLDEEACEALEENILNTYFSAFKNALERSKKEINVKELEENWRNLYPFAWTDFHRFVKGWSPGHWKIHSYSERLSKEVIESINIQKALK